MRRLAPSHVGTPLVVSAIFDGHRRPCLHLGAAMFVDVGRGGGGGGDGGGEVNRVMEVIDELLGTYQ